MQKNSETGSSTRKRWPVVLASTGLLAGCAAIGVVGVTAAAAAPVLASATPSPSSSPDGKKGHREGETEVTGTKATTLKAAALKAVPGGTVLRVETDSDGAAYEVHVKKTDGTFVTVKFDSSLKQTAIETRPGRGHGDHGGRSHGTEVTGTKAATLKAAALKAVPGGTVLRVEIDSTGTYEVHVEKADGTFVIVKFDAALKQTGIDTHTGKDRGDRHGGKGHGGDRHDGSGEAG